MAEHFRHIVSQVVKQPNMLIEEIELITPAEKEQILTEFNKTHATFPQDRTIHQLFEQQVQARPDQCAMVHGRERWSYHQLNQQANQLARLLCRKGLQREQIVGIWVDQRPEMLVGILGVLKAGGAYLPIDGSYPSERVRYMLADSQAPFLLIAPGLEVPDGYAGQVIVLQEREWAKEEKSNLPIVNEASDLAYVIYTSGSTGKPKGVMVEHRALVNLATWHQHYYQVTPEDQATKFASFGFDASVWEIFPYLIAGATIHLIPEAIRYELDELNRYYEEQGITISFLPTPLAEQFMTLENRSLRYLLVGGDQLRQVKPTPYQVVNNYGPTENTVVTTSWRVDPTADVLPIGRPIANHQVYVLSKEGHLQPIGVPGELYVSGAGLARGYLHREELTAAKFVPNPYIAGERMYRTGDRVRWLPNGELEYLGRLDHQVKIRGYRVELGEVESQLLKHPQIKDAVVLARKDEQENASLSAYIVSGKELSIAELRRFLSPTLPDYMIPSQWFKLDRMPLTPNGKVDVKRLEQQENGTSMHPNRIIPPRTWAEKVLAQVWKTVLRSEAMSIDDHFFERGGDSIKAMQVIAKLNQQGLSLKMKELFQKPTIRELAPLIRKKSIASKQPTPVIGKVPLTPIQKWAFQLSTQIHHWNMGHMLYKKEGWNPKVLMRAIQRLVDHHDVLRSIYRWTTDEVEQWIRDTREKNLYSLEVFDLRDEQNIRQRIEEEANRIHQSTSTGYRTADSNRFVSNTGRRSFINGCSSSRDRCCLAADFGGRFGKCLSASPTIR